MASIAKLIAAKEPFWTVQPSTQVTSAAAKLNVSVQTETFVAVRLKDGATQRLTLVTPRSKHVRETE